MRAFVFESSKFPEYYRFNVGMSCGETKVV